LICWRKAAGGSGFFQFNGQNRVIYLLLFAIRNF